MKSALILALASSAVAAPSFSDFLDALFGGDNNNGHNPRPSGFPSLPPLGTGTGTGVLFPFPTATGAPFPYPGSDNQQKRNVQRLHIDYELAPKAAPVVKRRELRHRQLDGSALPSFSLFDPNNTPPATEPATEPATGLPTELPTELPGLPIGTGAPEIPTGIPTDLPGLPTGFPAPPADGPTAPLPFPTGEMPVPSGEAPCPTDAPFPTAPIGTGAPGLPGLPTTFGTVTRGPQPTAAPDASEQDGEEVENGNAWLGWISNLLTGGKESQE